MFHEPSSLRSDQVVAFHQNPRSDNFRMPGRNQSEWVVE